MHDDTRSHRVTHGWRTNRPDYGAIRSPESLSHAQLQYYPLALTAPTLPQAEENYHRVFHSKRYARNLVHEFFNWFKSNKVSCQLDDAYELIPAEGQPGEDIDFQIILHELSDTLDEYECRALVFILNQACLIRCLGDLSAVPKLKSIIEELLRSPHPDREARIFVKNAKRYAKAKESLKRKLADCLS